MAEDTSVRVALRIRPQLAQERIDLCRVCTSVTPGEPQVIMGKDRAFTYDHVFDLEAIQEAIYDKCVDSLVEGCFEGLNATVLAYGQTGSGKTYTMGTGFDVCVPAKEQGIIPRAVAHIFSGIEKRRKECENGQSPEFQVSTQFLELYNEEIFDLFDSAREQGRKSNIKIHEDSSGGIYTMGITSCPVFSMEETMKVLQRGALSRTTASTCMNAQSSRSHAIFTLVVKQRRIVKCELGEGPKEDIDYENLSAKFHFVDLAGSERLKRTGATGDRAKEGISINCGLLALGNVISALGDLAKKSSHVPYRDSKLTRLLQDSLGGNSQTLMIACISPSDRDFMETLNTMKYANRARNIKNKVVVNQDKTSQVISQLRQENQRLLVELNEFMQGKRIVAENGVVVTNDLFHENTLLKAESDRLRIRLKAAQQAIDHQADRLADFEARTALNRFSTEGQLKSSDEEGEESAYQPLIKGYAKQIEDLRSQILQSEALARKEPRSPFRRLTQERIDSSFARPLPAGSLPLQMSLDSALFNKDELVDSLLQEAKDDIVRTMSMIEKRKRRKSDGDSGDESDEALAEAEDDESGDSTTSDSDEGEREGLNGCTESDLAQLSDEISIKQKLVDQLELSKRELDTMKEHYEDKMLVLQEKVRRTEKERDSVIQNISSAESSSEEAVKAVRGEYRTKLDLLQKEMKKLKRAKKEHQSLLQIKERNEQQLQAIKKDLQDMKRQKVRLMRNLREEANLNKQQEAKRNREIAQLKKEKRKQEYQIKSLVSAEKKRELVLKRKGEQIAMLRKKMRPTSRPTSVSLPQTSHSGRGARPVLAEHNLALEPSKPKGKHDRRVSSLFTSVAGRRKWRIVEGRISSAVMQKHTLTNMERDMDRWIKEREKLAREINECVVNKTEAMDVVKDETFILDVDEELETLRSNLKFAEANIQERENDIMALMDVKGEDDLIGATSVLNKCGIHEAKYFMEHFLNKTVTMGLELSEAQLEVQLLKEKLKASEGEARTKEEMLIQNTAQWDSELMQSQTDALSSLLHHLAESKSKGDVTEEDRPTEAKRKMVSFDVLKSSSGSSTDTHDSNSSPDSATEAYRQHLVSIISPRTKARRRTATPNELLYPVHGSPQVDASRGDDTPSLPSPIEKTSEEEPPQAEKKSDAELMPPPSKLPTRVLEPKKRPGGESSSNESPNLSALRKGVPHVFQRLSVTAELMGNSAQSKGTIVKLPSVGDTRKEKPLSCTHVFEGHSSSVLSIAFAGDWLCSGSQDRTVRVWDLEAEKEIMVFSQQNSVTKLVYSEESRLLFSASKEAVKIWDLRLGENKCVKTLGGPSTGSEKWKGGAIQDIAITKAGSMLYTAAIALPHVKVWDLHRFALCGKLTGHATAVSTLLLDERTPGSRRLYTGSRDHNVRIFDVSSPPTQSQGPLYVLEPPHYDGVQSLAICDHFLFSGSRDFSVKQWNLDDNKLKLSFNGAHNSWVNSLLHLPDSRLVVSGCRSGVVKLWAVTEEECVTVADVAAHTYSVNDMISRGSSLLTASSDKKIMLWKVREDLL
eukprot:m.134561 g.134561  ORF g.134561 m.134561 type:complete len:1548 (+) comp38146_c0_seq1:137-4780(+)